MLELVIAVPVVILVAVFAITVYKIQGKRLHKIPRRIAESLGFRQGQWTTIPKKYRKFSYYEGAFQGVPAALYVVHFRLSTGGGRPLNVAYLRLVVALQKLKALDYMVRRPPTDASSLPPMTRPIKELFEGEGLERVPNSVDRVLRRFAPEFRTFYLIDRARKGKMIVPLEILEEERVVFVHDMKGLSHSDKDVEERLLAIKDMFREHIA